MPEPHESAQDSASSNIVERRRPLLDLRAFVLLITAAAIATLIYVNPAAGLAVLGGITVLATLALLVGHVH